MSIGGPLFEEVATSPPAGRAERFGARWRLVGAGLCDVWRFGNLELPAQSGRLLLRGPNGTGKTTALEALWPYLLDLNATRLAAGKARATSLLSLMREGAEGKRRNGYAWLTLAGPGEEGRWSFGVRLQYAEGGSPPVRVLPFCVPGRPLRELPLVGAGGTQMSGDQFSDAVRCAGGEVFEDPERYASYLAARLFRTSNTTELAAVASRLRSVRNPALLGDVSPQAAASALRESLPGVDDDIINATADALAESDATREAFRQDAEAARLLEEFLSNWKGHVVEVLRGTCETAETAAADVSRCEQRVRRLSNAAALAEQQAAAGRRAIADLEGAHTAATARVRALEDSPAYRESGRLAALESAHQAQLLAANSTINTLRQIAASAFAQALTVLQDLEGLSQDLDECVAQAVEADSALHPGTRLASWSEDARTRIVVGGDEFDPGPRIRIHTEPQALRAVAEKWLHAGQRHRERADAALLALKDHKPVALAEAEADVAERTAQEKERAAEASESAASGKARAARALVDELLRRVRDWTQANGDLATATQEGEEAPGWEVADVGVLAGQEPAAILGEVDVWAHAATRRAAMAAASMRATAKALEDAANGRTRDASELRAQATALRGGRLLPFPRPDWAGPGDDARALGALLDWRKDAPTGVARDRIEAALSISGLLGATLSQAAAATEAWRVTVSGPVFEPNLTEILAVDASSESAPVALEVLRRIGVIENALDREDSHSLTIGRDGTFRAGVLAGCHPSVAMREAPPPATHVGARQRREAALRKADELDARATALEAEAEAARQEAGAHRASAGAIVVRAGSFPPREALRSAEAARVAAAKAALEERRVAEEKRAFAQRAGDRARELRMGWIQRTRALGLPPDATELTTIDQTARDVALRLEKAAQRLTTRLSERLSRARQRAEGGNDEQLLAAEAEASAARQKADSTAAALRTLHEVAGAAIEEVLGQLRQARERLDAVERDHRKARALQPGLDRTETDARSDLRIAELNRDEAQPRAAAALAQVRTVLQAPGVAGAVLGSEFDFADAGLAGRVTKALDGQRTLTRKTVRERADAARAALAGVWSLDPGEDVGELLTYTLTHRDVAYTPPQAVIHANVVKERAQRALAASEDRALQEFVIGRLPGAIGAAWTHLHEWKNQVNEKMRRASASSGVGVQVRIELQTELSPAARTVHRLCCTVSDAERLPEQQREVGAAIQSLIEAADGDGMRERLANAIDIREWVDVHYEVTRPGGKTQRWGSRTGLSGGERRLVVLAPMLAAVAAQYERYGSSALRLVALDEIPVEVDERGREGLARYIAALDLDLFCTSYLWDGCPGAWDGIDAHDLEAGPDGTVVAFPMLVRGLDDLPDEAEAEARDGL